MQRGNRTQIEHTIRHTHALCTSPIGQAKCKTNAESLKKTRSLGTVVRLHA